MDVPRVAYEKLTDQRLGEPSEVVRARVEAAREKQRACFAGTDLACNADMRSGPALLGSLMRIALKTLSQPVTWLSGFCFAGRLNR